MVSGLVDNLWLTRKTTIKFLPSPLQTQDIQFTANIISLGGTAFNMVTRHYQATGNPYFDATKKTEGGVVTIAKGNRKGEVIFTRSEPSKWDIGMIQKLKDQENRINVFIIAGLGQNGTRAALKYLTENWQQLYRMYGENEFGICLRCAHSNLDPEGYKRVDVLVRLPQ